MSTMSTTAPARPRFSRRLLATIAVVVALAAIAVTVVLVAGDGSAGGTSQGAAAAPGNDGSQHPGLRP
jgi:hypothetical protein